jgi:FkbM family methyltransferase
VKLLKYISFIKFYVLRLLCKFFNIKYVNKHTVYGFNIKLNLQRSVDRRIYLNSFERNNLLLFKEKIRTANIVMDIGSNIGIYSLIASRAKNIKIYSFEASKKIFEELNNNIKINNIKNIYTFNYAVSDINGIFDFYICNDDAYSSLGNNPMQEVIEIVKIRTITIDGFIKENNIPKIDIIKCDTEGAEYKVFKGAYNSLKKFKPKLFFEYNPFVKGFTNDPKDIFMLLKNIGYNFYEFKNNNLVRVNDLNFQTYDIYAE